MRVQGHDFDERLSQNEIRDVGSSPLGPSIVGRDSRPADQFYTIDSEEEPIQLDQVDAFSAEHLGARLVLQNGKELEKKVIVVESQRFSCGNVSREAFNRPCRFRSKPYLRSQGWLIDELLHRCDW